MNEASRGVVCQFCDKEFSNKSNCKKHIKAIHKVNSDVEKEVENEFTCVFCNRKFAYKGNLQRHIDAKHLPDQTNQKLSKCHKCNYSTHNKYNFKRHLMSFDHEKKQFCCSLCDAKYINTRGLKRHEQKVHFLNKLNKTKTKKTCPLCNFTSTDQSLVEMYSHFENIHEIQLKWEKHDFLSMTDFKKWKEEVEKSTTSFFIKFATYKNVHVYRCNRCGIYRKKGLNKRNTKIMKSCKINGICPARMKVTIKKGNGVKVSFLKTHVGHKNELKHKRLTKEERKAIAIKLSLKVPADQILKGLRTSLTNSDLQRIHLISRKDIKNIEKSFNLGDEALKHPFDPISIQAWVETLKTSSSNSFVFYKPQGVSMESEPNFDTDDFVLMFMTKAQEEMLKKCGEDVICMDGTHGTNSYDFQLYTLMVMDESREGFPVAFLISNKGDFKTFSFFMDKVREQVGKIKVKYFMSDMEDNFYKSWEKVMGPATQLYCAWHVLRAWKNNIRSKIKNKDKQAEIFKILRGLLYELDEKTFHRILEKAIPKLENDEETNVFAKYFLENYVQREMFKRWAYCYRVHSGINTNMSVENFNRLLKYCYLKGKKTKRLDKTLCALLNLLRDKLFDLIIKNQKGKVVQKLQILRRRHKDSYLLSEGIVLKEHENKWQVLSSSCKDFYCVTKVKSCMKCFLICDHCMACFHEYVCSCMDSSIKSNMCKHIHLVARTNVNNNPQEMYDKDDSLIIDDTEELIDTDLIISEVNSKFEEDKSKFEESLKTFLNDIGESITNMEELNFAKKHFASLKPTLEGMRKSTEAITNMKETEQFSSNSKIVPQKRFVSTKKQRNLENTFQDVERVILDLLLDSEEAANH